MKWKSVQDMTPTIFQILLAMLFINYCKKNLEKNRRSSVLLFSCSATITCSLGTKNTYIISLLMLFKGVLVLYLLKVVLSPGDKWTKGGAGRWNFEKSSSMRKIRGRKKSHYDIIIVINKAWFILLSNIYH